jgi:hypothetical protein
MKAIRWINGHRLKSFSASSIQVRLFRLKKRDIEFFKGGFSMKKALGYFLWFFVSLSFLAITFFAVAQPKKQERTPVSRLAEYQNVVWAAMQSDQRAMVRVEPTLMLSKAKLKLVVPGYEKVFVREENMDFTRFDVPGAGVTPVVGKPELPVVRRLVSVPEGAKVTFKLKAERPKILKNITVYPVQEPLPEGQPQITQRKFVMNREFYAVNKKYPAQLVTVSKPMKIRNVTVVMVEMAVMQYNLAKKELSVYPGIEINLSYSKPFSPAKLPAKIVGAKPVAKTEEKKALASATITKFLAQRYTYVIANFDWIKDLIVHLKWDYLILTPDAYYEEIQPLVQWKRDKGLSVQVIKLSAISASPTPIQIRDYIKTAYDDHAVDYVLLIGDTNTFPAYNYTGAGGTVTDYYYALVSGPPAGDYLPDLAVGRLSGRTEAEITNLVAKCVNYEKTPAAGAWKTKAICISDSGYFQNTSDYNYNLMTASGFSVDKIYATLGNATKANVSSAVNNGRLLISYRGHGSQTGWSTTGFSNADVNILLNGALLPVIISPTCLTGCYDYATSDCFSECWAKNFGTASRGAVAYWGSARISYGGYNDELSKGAFDDMFTAGNHIIGDVVNNAKLHMLLSYSATDPTALLELHMFNLFGDPGLYVNF